MQFVQRLDPLEKRFDELTHQMADPAVISDSEQYRKVAKAQSELSEIASKYREWKKVDDSLSQARQMLAEQDPDLRAMAEQEVARSEEHTSELQSRGLISYAVFCLQKTQ